MLKNLIKITSNNINTNETQSLLSEAITTHSGPISKNHNNKQQTVVIISEILMISSL